MNVWNFSVILCSRKEVWELKKFDSENYHLYTETRYEEFYIERNSTENDTIVRRYSKERLAFISEFSVCTGLQK